MSIVPLTLEAANMFCGSAPQDTSVSLHLKLAEVKLPHFEEYYIDHHPGGAPVAIEVDVMFHKLQCDFVILGIDPQVYRLQRAWALHQNMFFIYGVLRDGNDGSMHQVSIQIKGRLGNVEGQPWRRGDVYHTACSIRGIIYYNMSIGNHLVYNWNFFQNRLSIGREPPVNDTTRRVIPDIPLNPPIGVPVLPEPVIPDIVL